MRDLRSGRGKHVCWQVIEVDPPHHLVLMDAGTTAQPDVPQIIEDIPAGSHEP